MFKKKNRRCPGYFNFRQFKIKQDKCAMKVGTDSILLGAWLNVSGASRALDIGSGTGLLALMLAQRNTALEIVGMEIDAPSAEQAGENVRKSPWPGRIAIIRGDIKQFKDDRGYDLIVSNPPFYHTHKGGICKDPRTAAVRQTVALTYEQLIRAGADLLSDTGRMNLIIPAREGEELLAMAAEAGLICRRKTGVSPLPGRPAHRWLLELRKEEGSCETAEMTLEVAHHQYTKEVKALTKEFYVK